MAFSDFFFVQYMNILAFLVRFNLGFCMKMYIPARSPLLVLIRKLHFLISFAVCKGSIYICSLIFDQGFNIYFFYIYIEREREEKKRKEEG